MSHRNDSVWVLNVQIAYPSVAECYAATKDGKANSKTRELISDYCFLSHQSISLGIYQDKYLLLTKSSLFIISNVMLQNVEVCRSKTHREFL